MRATIEDTIVRTLVIWIFATSVVNGDKWRFINKVISECGEELPYVKYRSDMRLSYSNRGLVWRVAADFDVTQDFTVTQGDIEVYTRGISKMTVLKVRSNEACKEIEGRNKYVEPLFATGELPRSCHLKKGSYHVTNMTFDLTGEAFGSTQQYRGQFHYIIRGYDANMTMMFCNKGFGVIKITKS